MPELPLAIPPAAFLILGAPLLAVLRGWPRKVVQVLVPLLLLGHVITLHGHDPHFGFEWMGYGVDLLRVDALRFAFGLIFSIMALIGSIYALHVDDPLQGPAAWVYAGGALGVTFAGDWLAFVLFWELMGFSSAMLVFARRTAASRAAGTRYMAVHAFGGVLLVMGVILYVHGGGAMAVGRIPLDAGLAGWLMLVGVCINAAVPPLGPWLPDAYARGTVTGSVFLSAFTTKTAVFALIALFAGWKILLYAGVVMALYGVVYAVLENDIRRLLAYHIISQVGYMVAGAGMGTAMALDGATAHAFSHILYKSLLFMGAGSVVYATGKEKMTELGGLVRKMPVVLALYAVGAMSISGFPLFNGFISKSIVVSAGGQGGWPWAELLLTLAAVGTFLHTGLKLLWFTFVTPLDRPQEVRPLPKNMYVAMGIGAALCTYFGLPEISSGFGYGTLYRLLPFGTEYHPYSAAHVGQTLQLLAGTALAFWWLFDKLWAEDTISLDTDWIYRKPLPPLVMALSRGLYSAQERFGRKVGELAARALRQIESPIREAERTIGRGMVEEEHPAYRRDPYRVPVGVTVLLVLGVFAGLAVLHLLTRSGLP
ncbi:MAG: Na(+)/H(+) antiporter subunit D [Deltaproteobacteria bacterium]|nr:MAG: Na(+)/H(+) antiporter subunit D [Deltaproteobacteria bacterium]